MSREAPTLFVNIVPKGAEAERLSVSDRVVSIEYTDSEKKADKAVLKVDNFTLAQFDEPLFIEGGIMELSWGYQGNLAPTREVVIKKVKGSAQLSIEGNSKSVLLHKERKCRTFENMSYVEIVVQIAEEHGFIDTKFIGITPSAKVKEVLNMKRDIVSQARMTDAEFLRHLANKLGFEFYVDFDGLHFNPRNIGQKPMRLFTYYTDPGQGDIIRPPEIEVDTTGKKGKVRSKGRDPMNKSDIDATADNDSESADREVNADTQTVISIEGGSTVISQENVATSDDQPTSEDNQADAQATASGQYRRSQENSVTLKLETVGDPLVLAKSIIEVQGIGKTYSGNYYVSEAKHKISTSGYTMSLMCKRTGKTSGTGTSTGAAAKGKKNDQKADDNDSNELTPEITIKRGVTTVKYVDKKGRDK